MKGEISPPDAVLTAMVIAEKPQELTRRATDVAGLCREIVLKTACEIQGRKYVKVEGWQSIATAHGCVAGCRDVERIQGGYRAIGELRNISTNQVIATAEGFVGEDETTWFGGEVEKWERGARVKKMLLKRPDYAIRAMAQTRAISRVCRSAFAHVVVLMDAGLSTTPAEEVPDGGFEAKEASEGCFDDAKPQDAAQAVKTPQTPLQGEQQASGGDWRNFRVPFGKNKDVQLGELSGKSLLWYYENFKVESIYKKGDQTLQKKPETIAKDKAFRDALDEAYEAMVESGEIEDNVP